MNVLDTQIKINSDDLIFNKFVNNQKRKEKLFTYKNKINYNMENTKKGYEALDVFVYLWKRRKTIIVMTTIGAIFS
jgi:hypothetical protein